jgi:NADH:ubiquinone oxidoreductase subunit 5 (subunit L)/multisubunit Na+/H+ antiporter MnhA subunit
MAKAMPWTFAAFAVAALSISGVPPLNGFASKWMVYQGIVETGSREPALWVVWLVAAMLGSALTLASFAKVLHAAFLCKPAPELARRQVREIGLSMRLPVVFLAAVCVVFGILAQAVPLKYLIFPALDEPVVFPGVWWSGTATAMLLAAVGAGLLYYLITTARFRIRPSETFLGGERLAEAHVTGRGRGPERHLEMTGVDFYRTVEDLPVLHSLYRMAERKLFDTYEVGRRATFYFVEALRKAHTGFLSAYLTWFLVGLLVLLYLVLRKGIGDA